MLFRSVLKPNDRGRSGCVWISGIVVWFAAWLSVWLDDSKPNLFSNPDKKFCIAFFLSDYLKLSFRGVKKFGQLALVEPNGVFLYRQVHLGVAVFGLVNQDFGHGFPWFRGTGRLKKQRRIMPHRDRAFRPSEGKPDGGQTVLPGVSALHDDCLHF